MEQVCSLWQDLFDGTINLIVWPWSLTYIRKKLSLYTLLSYCETQGFHIQNRATCASPLPVVTLLSYTLNAIGIAPQFRTKLVRVRFWIKGSWRLWFGIWVLYFHRMLNITYQVPEIDWPLTLSARIGGHVTWVICHLPPMEIMEFLRIADVLSAVFLLDQHFFS